MGDAILAILYKNGKNQTRLLKVIVYYILIFFVKTFITRRSKIKKLHKVYTFLISVGPSVPFALSAKLRNICDQQSLVRKN